MFLLVFLVNQCINLPLYLKQYINIILWLSPNCHMRHFVVLSAQSSDLTLMVKNSGEMQIQMESSSGVACQWPLPCSAPLVANPCRSVNIAHMASEGVWNTRPKGCSIPPSDAILWAIFIDLHEFDTRGAKMKSGQIRAVKLKADVVFHNPPTCSIRHRRGITSKQMESLEVLGSAISKDYETC